MGEKEKALGLEIVSLIEKYATALNASFMANLLIVNAVSMLLYTSENELDGIKTALQCFKNGVSDYETNQS